MFTLQQLKTIAGELNLSCGNFAEFIGSLNNQGYLLKKGGQSYQLLTSAM
jgi:DNA helicase MCM8